MLPTLKAGPVACLTSVLLALSLTRCFAKNNSRCGALFEHGLHTVRIRSADHCANACTTLNSTLSHPSKSNSAAELPALIAE